jgi:hypothetical protein
MNSVYKGSYRQMGYGLGNQFKRFFKWIVPIITPAMEHVGRKALNTVGSIANDVNSGKSFKESAVANINSTVSDLKNDIERKLKGGKRKRKPKSKNSKKRRDIFS